MKCRYKMVSGWSKEYDCTDVRIHNDVLVIVENETNEVWVPMHTIRGPIAIDNSEVGQETVVNVALPPDGEVIINH